MKKRQKMLLGKAIKFNPSESITKGKISKKIPMGFLTEFQRKIKGFELSEYSSGPKFRNGDTLVAKITPCLENGKTAYVDVLENEEVAFGSSEFIILRNTEFSDPEFIYYFARSPLFRERAISCMEGTSGRKRVNENILKNFEFNFPTLQDQQKIASVLSTLDSKIELNNRINAELEAMAKTIYDYWFVQFDFPSSLASINSASDRTLSKVEGYKTSGGEMVYNQELKRQIPKGWEVKELGEVCEIYQPQTISAKDCVEDGKYFVHGSNGIIGKYHEYNHDDSEIIVSCRGDCGNIHRTLPKMWITGNAMVFKILDKNIHNEFLYQALRHSGIKNIASGSVQGQITRTNVSPLKIIIPEKKIIDKFSNIAKNLVSKKLLINEENQKLAELRDFLLPMLMNGQIVVE